MNAKIYGYLNDKTSLKRRLARIEGQVRGVSNMVDNERYCIDILTQISAINTALEAVGLELLNRHVKSCVTTALASSDASQAEAKTSELLVAVQRFAKTR